MEREKDPKATLLKMARLARLTLTPEEEELFARELGSILKHFQKINTFVKTDLSPMVHPLAESLDLHLRPDVVQQEMKTEEALGNASQRKGSFFKVPPVRKEKT